MGKLLLLTLDEQEEKIIDKIISALSNYIQLEDIQVTPVSVLSFPGLEIRQSQHRVFQGGEEVNLTRLEYSTLVFLDGLSVFTNHGLLGLRVDFVNFPLDFVRGRRKHFDTFCVAYHLPPVLGQN